jgi:hypothetical protein
MGTAMGGGTVRLSVGPFLSEEDVRYAVASIAEIAGEAKASLTTSTNHPAAATPT